jgi:hypothetical protein
MVTPISANREYTMQKYHYLQVLQLGKCYKFVFCTFLKHRKNVYINIFVSLQLMYLKKIHILIDFFVVFLSLVLLIMLE